MKCWIELNSRLLLLILIVTPLLLPTATGSSSTNTRLRIGGIDKPLIYWRNNLEYVQVEAYGKDSIRVRITNGRSLGINENALGAVLSTPEIRRDNNNVKDAKVSIINGNGTVINSLLTATIYPILNCCSGNTPGPDGIRALGLEFKRSDTNEILLNEHYPLHGVPARALRAYARGSGELISATIAFDGKKDERLYGLGQHQNGRLNQAGMVLDLEHFNTEVSIPFVLSSKNYGFLWNVPSRGRVELASGTHPNGRTRWFASATKQVDYMVFAGKTSFDVLERYVEATGHAPPFPDFALGYWQCKNRYANEKELLNVTKEFALRSLPLSIIVIDADTEFSPHVGDWRLNSKDWPNPKQMYKEIESLTGAKPMVSVWPTVEEASDNFQPLSNEGLFVSTETGGCAVGFQLARDARIVDQFHPAAQTYFWNQLKTNHFDNGVSLVWLDANEGNGNLGEDNPFPSADAQFARGSLNEIGLMYPYEEQRAVYEGWKDMNRSALPIMLSRSAFAGSQRFGAGVWSGDTRSDFSNLYNQVPAGMNMGMSGISRWTFDIGGYMGGNNSDPKFQELLVRWFQLGTFTPIMRMHGARQCTPEEKEWFKDCPNEPWSFGEENYKILSTMIHTRAKMKAYLKQMFERASESGRPPMRPLFFDFPNDINAVDIEDQYMFGDELMVAPILAYQQTYRNVYFPGTKNDKWINFWDDQEAYTGGTLKEKMSAPIDTILVFRRKNIR